MKKKIIISFLILSACTTPMSPNQQSALQASANRPVTCRAGKDCEQKWSRATQWVKQNSAYRFQVVSDNLIQTFGPLDSSTDSGFTITRVANSSDNTDTIDFSAACANWIECIPSVLEERASFADYVMGPIKKQKGN